jgi:DNA-binding PadR family transcriptional regulator
MSSAEPKLTVTSHALLSHLALQPWSAYELAAQRVRYFRYFWPRAERGLYNELKRLAAEGLATAEVGFTGRRQRTVYAITEAGRDALRRWLDAPLSPLGLEMEALLRIFSAPLGTREQLLRTLARVREQADDLAAFNDAIAQEYIEGRAPFQREAHVRTLVVDFLTDFVSAMQLWVERTAAEVESWPDLRPEGKLERAPERLLESRRRRRRHRAGGDGEPAPAAPGPPGSGGTEDQPEPPDQPAR